MAHAIEVHLSANVEKFNQGMAAAKKTTTENVGFIASIFNTVRSYFAGMWDSAKSFFSNLGDKAGAAWGSFKDSASSAFEKVLSMLPGMGRAAEDAGDKMEGAEKKSDGLISKIGTGLVAAAIAALAALTALTAKGLLIDSAFAKISISTDMGAGSLSKFQDAAKRSGVSVAELGTSVSKFQDEMKEAAAGTGGKIFANLGVSVKNSRNELLATDSTLIDFARHIAEMSSEAEKYDAAAKAGFGGKVQMLEDIAHASALASGTTDDQAAKVVQLGKVWHEILPNGKSMWEDISTSLSNKLTPALVTASTSILESKNKILDAFSQIYGGGSLFDKLTDKVAGWANGMAGYFSDVIKKATEAGIGLAGYIAKATGLGGALKTAPSAGYVPGATPLASGGAVKVVDEKQKKQIEDYTAASLAIKAQNDATREEIATGQALTAARREQIVLAAGVRDGTVKMTLAQYTNRMEELAGQDSLQKAAAAAKDARSAAEAAAKKESEQYAAVSAAIASKIAENKLELLTGSAVTEGQKLAIKIDADQASGKKALSAAHLAAAKAALVELDASEKLAAQAKAQKEVDKYIAAGTIARQESLDSLDAEYKAYGKSADAREMLMVAVKAEADMQKEIQRLKDARIPANEAELDRLEREKRLRIAVGEATLGQGKALAYATQLADENKKFVADSIFDEKGRAAALLAIDAKIWQERIQNAGAGTEAQKALQTQYDIWYSNQSLKPQIDEQRKMWESIESTAHDTFVSIFDSGKSAFDRLRDTLKNGLLDLLYQMVIKKWVLNIGASVGLTGGSSLAQAASGLSGTSGSSGASGLIGMAQTASTMYKAISGGFATLSSTVADAVQVGLYETGLSSEFLVNGSFATGAGAVAGVAAGILGGVMGGRLISGQYGSNSTVNYGTAIGAAVGSVVPVIGTAIGALVGGLLGGIGNRLFGMGDKKVTATGMSGTLSDAGLTGTNYQKWKQDGGWFRSDKSGTDKTALDPAVTAQFVQGFATIKAASAGFAASIGASADSLVGYSKSFDIALTADTAANEKAITDFFTGVGDEIALRLVPGLAQFNKSGETMATTLQRLAGDFDATNQVAMLLGKNGTKMFGSLTIDSAAARERLVELAGGVSTLSSQATAFAQNYLTEAERLAPVSEAVAAAMASLGLASVTTREQFKTVVQGLDVTTAAGAQQFASMMALSDAFAQVHAAIENTTAASKTAAEVLSERADLQKQLDQLTMSSTELLAQQRAALDASNRGLFDQVQAATAVKKANDDAKTSLSNFLSQTKTFATTVAGLNSNFALGSLSTLTPEQQYAEARRQFEQARTAAAAGDATAQSNLQGIENTFLTLSQKLNGGDAQYSSDLAAVMKANDVLAAWSAGQVDIAQASLDALNNSADGIAQLNATMLTVAANMQYLPTLTGDVSTPVLATVQAPTVDFTSYGNAIAAPLVAEIKALREEVKGLRGDGDRQTGALMQNNETVAGRTAETIVDGMHDAVTDGAYAAENNTRKPS